jgi:hypothetical protein
MSFDVWRRAAFQLAVSSALVLSSAALARAVCETVVIPPANPPEFVVGSGCHFMLVKMWGNGGNAGDPGEGWQGRGRGGGGAALTAVYEVEEGQRFRARVLEPYGNSQSWQAFATVLYEVPPTGPHYRMRIAGAGGGGGNQITGAERTDGGAGGEVGQKGLRRC